MMPIHFHHHIRKLHARDFRVAAREAVLSLEKKAKDELERKLARAEQMKEMLKGITL